MTTASGETGGPGDLTPPGPPVPPDPPGPPGTPERPGPQGSPGQSTDREPHPPRVPHGARAKARGYAILAAGGAALGMHLVAGAAYALTLALAPLWVSALLALWWLVLLLGGLAMLARRSPGVLAVPLLAIASWAALIAAGRAWFDWS